MKVSMIRKADIVLAKVSPTKSNYLDFLRNQKLTKRILLKVVGDAHGITFLLAGMEKT